MHVCVVLQEALPGVPGEPDQRPRSGPGAALRQGRAGAGLPEVPGGAPAGRQRGRQRLQRAAAEGEAAL